VGTMTVENVIKMQIPEPLSLIMEDMNNICDPFMIDPVISRIGFPSDLERYQPRYVGAARDMAARWLREAQENGDSWTIGDLWQSVTDFMAGYARCVRDFEVIV